MDHPKDLYDLVVSHILLVHKLNDIKAERELLKFIDTHISEFRKA
jgi:hypothetical protein